MTFVKRLTGKFIVNFYSRKSDKTKSLVLRLYVLKRVKDYVSGQPITPDNTIRATILRAKANDDR